MSKDIILISMPVYNAEATLEKAIKSILGQKHKNFILNIIDDCSTDRSLEIAMSFLDDPRVNVYTNKVNMGAYYCRNYGLHVSRNDKWSYFTTHDADDISFENRYRTIIRKIQKQPYINGVQDTFDRIDAETGKTLRSKLTMAHAVFTREVFDSIGYFDNVRFGGDWEHWRRLEAFNVANDSKNTTAGISTVLGESYIHSNNLTITIPEDSPKRVRYMERAKNKLKKLSFNNNFYFDFEPERGYTKKVS